MLISSAPHNNAVEGKGGLQGVISGLCKDNCRDQMPQHPVKHEYFNPRAKLSLEGFSDLGYLNGSPFAPA